jgi:MutS domain I protein
MIDLFRQLKLEYKEYVILFKSGSFYISFDEDSIILNKIFNYKILNLKNNIKAGFPLNNIDMVKEKLKELKINYIIVEDKTIEDVYENESNNFKEYTSSVFEVISINNRINKIVDKLKCIDNNKLKDVLTEIESMIDI